MTVAREALGLGDPADARRGLGPDQPLAKIAVSEGHGHFGLVFWQLVIGAVILGRAAGRAPRRAAADGRALSGLRDHRADRHGDPQFGLLPGRMHLPAGVLSILLSLVPMMAFPWRWRSARTGSRRPPLLGCCSAGGVLLLVAPEASLPDRAMLAWIPLALIAPLFYAFEGNFVARWGTAGLDPSSCCAAPRSWGRSWRCRWRWPAAVHRPRALGRAGMALVLSSLIHVLVYTGYVWLVGRAGPVFTAQVAYLVTGFGVIWAIWLLGESYSPYIWAALG
jgi:drug/metabolite transporter (DMT)-like permease